MTSENIFLFRFYTSLFGEPRDVSWAPTQDPAETQEKPSLWGYSRNLPAGQHQNPARKLGNRRPQPHLGDRPEA